MTDLDHISCAITATFPISKRFSNWIAKKKTSDEQVFLVALGTSCKLTDNASSHDAHCPSFVMSRLCSDACVLVYTLWLRTFFKSPICLDRSKRCPVLEIFRSRIQMFRDIAHDIDDALIQYGPWGARIMK